MPTCALPTSASRVLGLQASCPYAFNQTSDRDCLSKVMQDGEQHWDASSFPLGISVCATRKLSGLRLGLFALCAHTRLPEGKLSMWREDMLWAESKNRFRDSWGQRRVGPASRCAGRKGCKKPKFRLLKVIFPKQATFMPANHVFFFFDT